MRRALALLTALLFIPPGSEVHAQTAAPNRVVVVTQGVRITASVPRHAYPRGALVGVWMGLRNVSRHVVDVPGSCSGPNNPHVTVLTGDGRMVFPPLIPVPIPQGPPVMGCMAARPIPLKPGQSLHWRQDAVARGRRILAWIGLGGARDLISSRWLTVTLHVRLTAADPPELTVLTAPSVAVNVAAAPGAGPLMVSEWWFCPGDIRANGANTRMLEPLAGARITLPCPRPQEWHGVVGRINHSLARFDYTARTPATTP